MSTLDLISKQVSIHKTFFFQNYLIHIYYPHNSVSLLHSLVSAKNTFEEGSVIEYNCQEGHILKGSRNRTCENGGQWSGQPPICEFFDCGDLRIAGM